MSLPETPTETPNNPQEQKAGEIKSTFESFSSAVSEAFDDKAREYAERIKKGEDPKTMGVPLSMQPLVINHLNAGSIEGSDDTKKTVDATPTERSLDFGDEFDRHGGISPTAVKVGESGVAQAYIRGSHPVPETISAETETEKLIRYITDVAEDIPPTADILNMSEEERKIRESAESTLEDMVRDYLKGHPVAGDRSDLCEALAELGHEQVYDKVSTEIWVEEMENDNNQFSQEFGFRPEAIIPPSTEEMRGIVADFQLLQAEASENGINVDDLYYYLAPIMHHINLQSDGRESPWKIDTLVKHYYRATSRIYTTRERLLHTNELIQGI